MFDFGLVKEALEERGLLLTRLAPHLVRPVPFLYPLHQRLGAARTSAPGWRSTTRMAMLGKYDMGVPEAPAPVPQAGRPDRARPQDRAAARRDPLLRLPGRRRPAGHDDRAHGRLATARTSPPAPRWSASCARASGSSACARSTSRPGASSRSAPGWWSTPPASGPTRSRRWSAAAASLNVQASKGIHLVVPARPDPLRVRLHHQDREVRALRDPVGPALDHRHHRHRRGTSTRRTPRPARPTSTTCSHTSTRSCASRSTTRTSRACTPGCGRCCAASPSRPVGSRASTPSSRPVPGLVMIAGGKLTTYRVMARDAVDAAAHSLTHRRPRRPSATRSPTGCRWSAPPTSRPGQPAGAARRAGPACTSPGSTTCWGGTAAWSTTCWR